MPLNNMLLVGLLFIMAASVRSSPTSSAASSSSHSPSFPKCGSMDNPSSFRCAGRETLMKAKAVKHNRGVAKNIAIFIGDGMGVSTVTGGRILQGQQQGQTGEENSLFFESFPALALSKTYNPDRQVPDSAGTATAIFSGVKANYGTLGLDNTVPFGKSCDKMTESTKLKSIVDHAKMEGKSVGIITTARVTHATPAATYAHTPNRNWESDADMEDAQGCGQMKDISRQLVEDNPHINVILGGGKRSFYPALRKDNRSLVEEWKSNKEAKGQKYRYVETKGQLQEVNAEDTDFLFGLFAMSHTPYDVERVDTPQGQPSFTDMVDKALQILRKNPKGFVLVAEGARIDHGHHDNLAKKALLEVVAFDKAVRHTHGILGDKDTLTIVTADHSHVFNIAGYPTRGNNILGLVDRMEPTEEPTDGLPYSTLTYANGPVSGRTNLTGVDTTGNNFGFPGCVKMNWETHGGEDVAIYATGPMSHLFHATHEQNYIGHVMMYAACIGDYRSDEECDRLERQASVGDNSRCGGDAVLASAVVALLCLLVPAAIL